MLHSFWQQNKWIGKSESDVMGNLPAFNADYILTYLSSVYGIIAAILLCCVLAVLIFALLGYVVFRSTRKEKETEIEPELSVESLLETTKQAEQEDLEDIGYNEKSEIRVLIEKFVDENPEAVASLLRNWLNEEWE